MKKIRNSIGKLTLLLGLILIVHITSGCSTVFKTTRRTLTVRSNVPEAMVTVNDQGPIQVPAVFKLGTFHDRKGVSVKVEAPGRPPEFEKLTWVTRSDGMWLTAGGTGGAFVISGLGCLVPLGIDLGTRAHRDLSQDTLTINFPDLPPPVVIAPPPPQPEPPPIIVNLAPPPAPAPKPPRQRRPRVNVTVQHPPPAPAPAPVVVAPPPVAPAPTVVMQQQQQVVITTTPPPAVVSVPLVPMVTTVTTNSPSSFTIRFSNPNKR